MTDQFSAIAEKIRALGTNLVSLVETTRSDGVPLRGLGEAQEELIEEYQKLLNEGAKLLLQGETAGSETALRAVEDACGVWRSVDSAFRETLSLAYDGTLPRRNLLIDDVHAELGRRAGDPVAALYARLRSLWSEHLEGCPWDAHLSGAGKDTDSEELERCIHALVHGDHLDVEDALSSLTGTLRYSFADYLERQKEPLDLLEESLWMRPEIVLINDYWRYHPHVKLLDLFRRKSRPRFAGAFAKIQEFFSEDYARTGNGAAERIVEEVRKIRPEEREPYIRCLMLHPNHEIRRYAVTNAAADGFWKTVTPDGVPLTTLLSMLEKVAGSKQYDENFQKIFFHAIHRRLLSVTSRSEVLYARGIVRILADLPFFMEDAYFDKLMTAVDYLTAKETAYRIEAGVFAEYIEKIRKEKSRIGTLRTDSVNIVNVPAVVLRKLARDGHFWYELAAHPHFKIARETIRHINDPERALRIANNHVVNQDVLREVGRRRGLFGTRPARLALLSNPRTPPAVSLDYLPDLTRQDKEQLLRRSTIHPELRRRIVETART
jgi:hypothetical protein